MAPLPGAGVLVAGVETVFHGKREVVRLAAAVPGRLFGKVFGAEGRLSAGFFGGALARNGIAESTPPATVVVPMLATSGSPCATSC